MLIFDCSIIISGPSKFYSSKWEGEQAVREEFPEAIIFRPADIFGLGDRFGNYYGFPFRRTWRPIPLWRSGRGIFKAPVYVSDVAKAVLAAVNMKGNEGLVGLVPERGIFYIPFGNKLLFDNKYVFCSSWSLFSEDVPSVRSEDVWVEGPGVLYAGMHATRESRRCNLWYATRSTVLCKGPLIWLHLPSAILWYYCKVIHNFFYIYIYISS